MSSGGRRRRSLAAVLLLGLVAGGTAACADGTASTSDPPTAPTTGAPPPTASPGPTTSGATDGHTVPPPGELTGGLAAPDLLVVGTDTLPAGLVAKVRKVEGVTTVEPISLAQVSVQGRVLDVAAVDPASYRRWTGPVSARTAGVWQRVADGYLAVDRSQGKRLRPLAAGVPLGSDASAPTVKLGAIAPQAGQIDAVVNDTWIPTLKMRPRNALLVSTGITAPAGVQKPVQAVVGQAATVSRLDVADRLGLDPSVTQTALVVGSIEDAVGVYRYSVSGGRVIPDPTWVATHIGTESVPILGDVTCNRAMIPQLRGALQDVVDAGLTDAIHPSEYGGCYNARFIAGTTSLSNHAFGLAVDLNVPGNLRGSVGQINRQVVAIFQRWGFSWGGTWRFTDPMHFELSSIVRPS